MLEVCERFPAIGTIENYQALPPGEKALYGAYTRKKIEIEARQSPVFK